MPATEIRTCLHCGFETRTDCPDFRDPVERIVCPKCDDALFLQSDGSTLTRDIAHQGETLDRAVEKLDVTLQSAWAGYARAVRLIVGGGRIRDEILGQLRHYQDRGYIRDFATDSRNPGAITVVLR